MVLLTRMTYCVTSKICGIIDNNYKIYVIKSEMELKTFCRYFNSIYFLSPKSKVINLGVTYQLFCI